MHAFSLVMGRGVAVMRASVLEIRMSVELFPAGAENFAKIKPRGGGAAPSCGWRSSPLDRPPLPSCPRKRASSPRVGLGPRFRGDERRMGLDAPNRLDLDLEAVMQ